MTVVKKTPSPYPTGKGQGTQPPPASKQVTPTKKRPSQPAPRR
jgi:hypothetical protein